MSDIIQRPTKASLFGDDWTIEYPCEQTDFDPKYQGRTFFRDRRIVVANETGNYAAKTLLHELIHVVSEYSQAELKEEQVVRIENGLWAIMRDNPDIADYLHAAAKARREVDR